MAKSQRSFGSKVRIATAGLVLGLGASLISSTAAHAAPKSGGFGCTVNPQLCEQDSGGKGFGCNLVPQLCDDGGTVVTDPPPPPKPPKCQVVLCDGDLPVLEPVTNPEPEPTPEPEDPKTEDPKTEDPKTEEPKTEEPTTDTPDNTGNTGNGNATGNGNGTGTRGTVIRNVPQVQQADETQADEKTDEIQTVAQNEAPEAQSGLSQFAKLLIVFTLGGAAYGLVNYLRQRKHS